MKKTILFFAVIIVMILNGCGKDPVSPKQPDILIRLKTGSGLNYGAFIYYMALSKTVDFRSLAENKDIFKYDKTKADWYIDGGSIPFITDYKRFTRPISEYYYLLRASGVAMMSVITVKEGKQAWVISGESYGGLDINIEQP